MADKWASDEPPDDEGDEESSELQSADCDPPVPRICGCFKRFENVSSISKLLSQRVDERIFYPRTYLCASHEVFAFTLVLTWSISLIWYPHQVFKHPALPIIGSYNPCFGWDYPPASYIALTLCSINVYFTWRYAWLEQARSFLLNSKDPTFWQIFSKYASILLALSSNTWLLLWLIGPNADEPEDDDPEVLWWFLHTGIFIIYAFASYLAFLGNYMVAKYGPVPGNITLRNKIFVYVYGLSGTYLATVYCYDLFMFEKGKPPPLDSMFTQLADILWMTCISAITHFMPRESPLHVTMKVIPLDDFDA